MSAAAPHSGLAEANAVFRSAYARARDAAAREVPILVVLADDLILRHGDRRSQWCFTPKGFHDLKAAAHTLVVVASLLAIEGRESKDAGWRERLETLQRALETTKATQEGGEPSEADPCLEKAKGLAGELVDRALREGGASPGVLAEHARKAQPILLELTRRAARARLARLHACVEEALAPLDAEARASLRVVVAGDHQARARSLGMQYFARRLGERESGESAVTYGESVTSEDEAVALVGTCRIDRTIAEAVFGDPKKLQQDVLGDATQAELEKMDLPKIA